MAIVVLEGSALLVGVSALGRPLRPEERCCCSESDVVGAGVLGGSVFTFGGLPARLLGGSSVSEAWDITD